MLPAAILFSNKHSGDTTSKQGIVRGKWPRTKSWGPPPGCTGLHETKGDQVDAVSCLIPDMRSTALEESLMPRALLSGAAVNRCDNPGSRKRAGTSARRSRVGAA